VLLPDLVPELPEAEHSRRLIERLAAGVKIARAWCADDTIVFDGRADVARKLRGRTVHAVHRHGKYVWLELDHGPHPILHLGMTGTIRYLGDDPLRLSSSPKQTDRAWPPRFTKLRLELANGEELAMTNARRFGRVYLRDSPRESPPLSKLGFDPLTDMPPFARFAELLERRQRAQLKGLLLDQKFAAGVGNWIADEVLYQAAIDPRRRVASLSLAEQKALHRTLRRVITRAVRVDARKNSFPRTWLFHHRWGRDPDAKTARGERVEFLDLAGRTTAWVPTRQR
jgi:formamidopyrimidine-DNA glycosylase